MLRFIGSIFFLSLTAWPAASAQEYRIGPDDVLKISIYREDDMDRTVRVSPDGYVSFPLLGKVRADGLTVSELERAMAMDLVKYLKSPQVTVFIQEYGTVTVSGQVEKPGSYPLKGQLSVIEAISMAGGFTKLAAQNAVKVMRLENGKKKTLMMQLLKLFIMSHKIKEITSI